MRSKRKVKRILTVLAVGAMLVLMVGVALAAGEWQELLGDGDMWRIQRRADSTKPWKTLLTSTKAGKLTVRSHIKSNRGYIVTGVPTSPGGLSKSDISSTDDCLADDIMRAGNYVAAGIPSIGCGTGDVCADDELRADSHLRTSGGYIVTGSPTSPGGLSNLDISSTDDCLADDIMRAGRYVAAGLPSSTCGVGDVCADDDLVADDDIFAGGTKYAVVQTQSFGQRLTAAIEGAQVWLVDQGQGQLEGGVATITLDPMFLEMVATDTMLVQVTLTSEAKGVWVEKGGQGFTVRELQGGDSNATFDWQVSAIRKGYEGTRLEERDEGEPAAVDSGNDPPGTTPEELVTPVESAAPAQNDSSE